MKVTAGKVCKQCGNHPGFCKCPPQMSDELIAQYTNDIAEDMGGKIPKVVLRELVMFWSRKHSVKCSEFATFRTAVLSQVLKQTSDFTAFLAREETEARLL